MLGFFALGSLGFLARHVNQAEERHSYKQFPMKQGCQLGCLGNIQFRLPILQVNPKCCKLRMFCDHRDFLFECLFNSKYFVVLMTTLQPPYLVRIANQRGEHHSCKWCHSNRGCLDTQAQRDGEGTNMSRNLSLLEVSMNKQSQPQTWYIYIYTVYIYIYLFIFLLLCYNEQIYTNI